MLKKLVVLVGVVLSTLASPQVRAATLSPNDYTLDFGDVQVGTPVSKLIFWQGALERSEDFRSIGAFSFSTASNVSTAGCFNDDGTIGYDCTAIYSWTPTVVGSISEIILVAAELQYDNVDAISTRLTIVGRAISPVPVPAALPLLATGLGALGVIGWRRKKRKLALAQA